MPIIISAANLTKISDICVAKVLKDAQKMYFYKISLFLPKFSCLKKCFIDFHLHCVRPMVEQHIGVHGTAIEPNLEM